MTAALCVGIGFQEPYSCRYYKAPANETRCISATFAYVVAYSETNDGTVGDIYNLDTGGHMGVLFQAATGEFEIYMDSGASASCVINGDVARFCYD